MIRTLGLSIIGLMLLAFALGGCGIHQRRLAAEQADCVLNVVRNDKLDDHDKAFLARMCRSLYLVKGGRY